MARARNQANNTARSAEGKTKDVAGKATGKRSLLLVVPIAPSIQTMLAVSH